MTEPQDGGNPNIDDLWMQLVEDVPAAELDEVVLASDINAQTASAMSGTPADRERIRLRMSGPTIRFHHVATRTATAALAAFQDAVSSFGAVVADRSTTAGRIPSDILRATELHLAPVVLPGSVIFTMVPRGIDEPALVASADEDLLDQSVERLLDLLRELSDETPETSPIVLERIRDLGPRAQKHLRELSRVLVSDDLELDVDWRGSTGRRDVVTVTHREAAKLRQVVGETSTTVEEEELRGHLVTVSSEDDQALRLADGTRVALEVEGDVRHELRQFWDTIVKVRVRTEKVTNLNTGRTLETRTIQSISAD
jgi:hypothetical protein